MKKLFLFLSICSALFLASCSNFFAPFNDTGRIVINFSSKNAAKSIFNEVPDLNPSSIPIKVTITHKTTGETQVSDVAYLDINPSDFIDGIPGICSYTFENVRTGKWIVTCSVVRLSDGKITDEIAFDKQEVTVEAGNTVPVTLKPLYNIVSPSIGVNVSSLKLIKAPSKTSYILDDPLQADDAIFEIELSNGYKTEMTFPIIQSTFDHSDSFSIDVSFAKEPNETPVYNVNQATRFYYYILYTYGNKDDRGAFEPNYISVPITLSAKPPVITEQPVSTSFSDVYYNYEFSVTAELPSYSDANTPTTAPKLRYYWHDAGTRFTNNIIDLAIENGNTFHDTGSLSDDSNLYYTYKQCSVINYDTEGLNGEPPVVESRYATLERRYLGTTATNQTFIMNDSDISLSDETGKEFFISEYKEGHWTVPSIEMFKIEKSFTNGVYSLDSKIGYYYDFTESNNKYNITVERVNTSDLPIFGYVPYKVSYRFEEDDITWEPNRYNEAAERYKIIYVPTKLASVPDVSFEYADGNYTNNQYDYCERYYNIVDGNYYGYKNGTTRQQLPDTEPDEVSTNSFCLKGIYYENETEDYKKVDLLSCKGIRNGWSADMTLNKKGEHLELGSISDNQSILKTAFYEQDCLRRVPPVDFFIYLEAYFSVSDEFKEWVINKNPAHKTLPTVKFSIDNN